MTTINPKLFKKYDIRGKAEGDDALLTQDVAFVLGQALGTYFRKVENLDQVVVGGDNRRTSLNLQFAVMNGLKEIGCQVIDIGTVSTPVVYWHAVNRGNIGGVMITGSHLTAPFNGMKMSIGNRNIYGEQIQIIKSYIDDNQLMQGEGSLEVDTESRSKYLDDLSQRIEMARPLKVVIDPGNGSGGLFAPDLFERWGHEVIGIYIEPDGSYPNHIPNPQSKANMKDLGAKVREVEADIGVAFDGDADRMGAVDENGEMIQADRILALLAQDMLKRHPNATVVGDVLCSQVLFDAIEDAGGRALMAASGHSVVKDKMREENALLGGEMSGHIFLGEDYFSFDDGYFAAGRVMQLLASSDKPLSQWNAELPSLYSTPEYRPHCPDEDKQTVISGIAEQLVDKGQVVDVDGLRIQFDNGWGLLRASNTEPVLSMRFEGKTEVDALAYRDMFFKALQAYPQVEQPTTES